jgi:hypothetical protein
VRERGASLRSSVVFVLRRGVCARLKYSAGVRLTRHLSPSIKKESRLFVCFRNSVRIPVKHLSANSKKINPAKISASSHFASPWKNGIAVLCSAKSLLQFESTECRHTAHSRGDILSDFALPRARLPAGKNLLVPVILNSSQHRLLLLPYSPTVPPPSVFIKFKYLPQFEHQWYPSLFHPSFYFPVGRACVSILCGYQKEDRTTPLICRPPRGKI